MHVLMHGAICLLSPGANAAYTSTWCICCPCIRSPCCGRYCRPALWAGNASRQASELPKRCNNTRWWIVGGRLRAWVPGYKSTWNWTHPGRIESPAGHHKGRLQSFVRSMAACCSNAKVQSEDIQWPCGVTTALWAYERLHNESWCAEAWRLPGQVLTTDMRHSAFILVVGLQLHSAKQS